VINPNNPSATLHPAETLLGWRKQMSNEAVLIVDEAFIDSTPQHSLLPHLPNPTPTNTLVLRSVGKFFGLAGARVGFCFAHPQHLKKMSQNLGPWTLPGPSRYVVQHALSNWEWQVQTRETLHLRSQRLHGLLSKYFEHVYPQILFQRVELSDATKWHHALATQGVFTRLCDEKDAIRFGLPHQEVDWKKLESALNQIKDML
ncbi:aminotransferase class I/II-fold pyridoxal phosphate-dependent enzyme, partial [Vibrio sp. M260118]|uniref:aminotransferase class I/II-fold pyridoxal phosphate-dependent enzyme n=1 Tax=Vibrio sp. M260118 TaxID=3020896 RepID=UPI002F41DF9A